MKPQITLAGTDTSLSLAADDHISFHKEYLKSKEVYENSKRVVAAEMVKSKISELHVGDDLIILVPAKDSEDSVKIKKPRKSLNFK